MKPTPDCGPLIWAVQHRFASFCDDTLRHNTRAQLARVIARVEIVTGAEAPDVCKRQVREFARQFVQVDLEPLSLDAVEFFVDPGVRAPHVMITTRERACYSSADVATTVRVVQGGDE